MVRRDSNYVEFIYCGCGCGFTRSKYNALGQLALFIHGHSNKGKHLQGEHRKRIGDAQKGEKHHFYGKKLSVEHRKKISNGIMGENNPNWVGENFTTIEGIHYRIRQQKPKPEFCEICGLVPPQELSNIDHKYSLNVDDYRDLCIRCHREYDDNYNKNFKTYNDAKRLKKE